MLKSILSEAIERKASDIHLVLNSKPILRINGDLHEIEALPILTKELLSSFTEELLDEEARNELNVEKYRDFSVEHGECRFRAHVYLSKGADAYSFRLIPSQIPTLDELRLPKAMRRLLRYKDGLILVTGPTGSGKSTTLAALIDEINRTERKLIVTVEDPIEFVHRHQQSIVVQKEVGTDISDFTHAVRAVMREDPDILLLGEMRDLETISNAITMAETGHLVFATLHTKSVAETTSRIIDIFPAAQQSQVRVQLAQVLQAVVAQRLLPDVNGRRVAACEIMFVNDAIRNLIREQSALNAINDQIQNNNKRNGSQTFLQAYATLYAQGFITLETAERNCADEKELEALRRMIIAEKGAL